MQCVFLRQLIFFSETTPRLHFGFLRFARIQLWRHVVQTTYHPHGGTSRNVKGQRLTLPSSSSCGVSTPWSGTRSPVKLFVCVSGRFTPLMCDIAAGPLCARSFFFAARASALPAAATASSIRKDGKSSSCCLSAGQKSDAVN